MSAGGPGGSGEGAEAHDRWVRDSETLGQNLHGGSEKSAKEFYSEWLGAGLVLVSLRVALHPDRGSRPTVLAALKAQGSQICFWLCRIPGTPIMMPAYEEEEPILPWNGLGASASTRVAFAHPPPAYPSFTAVVIGSRGSLLAADMMEGGRITWGWRWERAL